MSPYDPIYEFMGTYKEEYWQGARNDYVMVEDSLEVTMPEKANKALCSSLHLVMQGSPTTVISDSNVRALGLIPTMQLR